MKYDCILLAAGLSSRMEQWKLELQYNGKTLIENAIDNASRQTENIIVSGGFNYLHLNKILHDYNRIHLVNNPDYEKGMITSIKAALPFVKTDKFFIALSDMPLISPEIYLQMSSIEFDQALFPVYEGSRGHPVLIDTSLIDSILSIPDSGRMKDFLNTCSVSEMKVKDNGVLFDVDTMSDYRKLLDL